MARTTYGYKRTSNTALWAQGGCALVLVLAAMVLVLAAIGLLVCGITFSFTPKAVLTGYITNAYVRVSGNQSTYMLNVQQDGGGTAVVSDGDNWVQGKTNASDWYATLTDDMRAHRHVRLTTVGIRFSPLSWYSNVVGREVIGR